MTSINSTIISGRILRPELKYAPTGTAIFKFCVMVNDYDKREENNEYVSFVDCVAFGKQAEIISGLATEKQMVVVAGHIRQERWERAGGEKGARINIIAEKVIVLPPTSNRTNNIDEQRNYF